jgi:hypothetical protein
MGTCRKGVGNRKGNRRKSAERGCGNGRATGCKATRSGKGSRLDERLSGNSGPQTRGVEAATGGRACCRQKAVIDPSGSILARRASAICET